MPDPDHNKWFVLYGRKEGIEEEYLSGRESCCMPTAGVCFQMAWAGSSRVSKEDILAQDGYAFLPEGLQDEITSIKAGTDGEFDWSGRRLDQPLIDACLR